MDYYLKYSHLQLRAFTWQVGREKETTVKIKHPLSPYIRSIKNCVKPKHWNMETERCRWDHSILPFAPSFPSDYQRKKKRLVSYRIVFHTICSKYMSGTMNNTWAQICYLHNWLVWAQTVCNFITFCVICLNIKARSPAWLHMFNQNFD